MSSQEKPTALTNHLDQDRQTLDRLAFVHTVYGAVVAVFSLAYLGSAIALFVGTSWALMGASANIMFALFNALSFLGIALYAYLNFRCAQLMKKRRNLQFATYVSGLNTMFFPVGTLLGIRTYHVLSRPSVNELYGATAASLPKMDQTSTKKTAGVRLVTAPEPPATPVLPFHEAMAYADSQEEALWKEIEEKHRREQSESTDSSNVGG